MKSYLLIKDVKIHNANAMSSPYTIGFPAMTAWLGFVHALQRAVQKNGFEEVLLKKTAVACNDFDLQTYKGKNDFDYSIIGTRNPLKSDGKPMSFIEEARCHLEVSLLIEVEGVHGDNKEKFQEVVRSQLYRMKMAGGDILSFGKLETKFVDANNDETVRKFIRTLMLGFVIIERRDLMTAAMSEGEDALEALLGNIKVVFEKSGENHDGKISWKACRKKERGWIVPIAVGFRGISEICKAKNQRDENTDHRFAESVVTLGEFIMSYRFQNVDDMMWSYCHDSEQNLYVCKNKE